MYLDALIYLNYKDTMLKMIKLEILGLVFHQYN